MLCWGVDGMGWYLSSPLPEPVMSCQFLSPIITSLYWLSLSIIKTKLSTVSTINYLFNVKLLISHSFPSGVSWKVLISADAGGAELSRGWQHLK